MCLEGEKREPFPAPAVVGNLAGPEIVSTKFPSRPNSRPRGTLHSRCGKEGDEVRICGRERSCLAAGKRQYSRSAKHAKENGLQPPTVVTDRTRGATALQRGDRPRLRGAEGTQQSRAASPPSSPPWHHSRNPSKRRNSRRIPRSQKSVPRRRPESWCHCRRKCESNAMPEGVPSGTSQSLRQCVPHTLLRKVMRPNGTRPRARGMPQNCEYKILRHAPRDRPSSNDRPYAASRCSPQGIACDIFLPRGRPLRGREAKKTTGDRAV